MAQTANISRTAAQVMHTGMASYRELDTVLGLEDAMNILEVHQVYEYNGRVREKYSNEHH